MSKVKKKAVSLHDENTKPDHSQFKHTTIKGKKEKKKRSASGRKRKSPARTISTIKRSFKKSQCDARTHPTSVQTKTGNGTYAKASKRKVTKSALDSSRNDSRRSSSCMQKELLIEDTTRSCYICNSIARYLRGSFFCELCKIKFHDIVKAGDIITCMMGGKCVAKQICNFCLAEEFYSHGIEAIDVPGFNHKPYRIPGGTEFQKTHLNNEDRDFCRYYNKCLNTVFDWVWEQGDILKLTPNDRLSIFEMNAGRARVLWIVAEVMPRHDVLKTTDTYIPIRKFSSKIVCETVLGINSLASYFRSLKFTPQHMYFVKLLSIFQIGKLLNCSKSPHPNCVSDEDNFDKINEIRLLAENYWKLLGIMKVSEDDLRRIRHKIDSMYCINAVMSKEEGIEDADMKFSLWSAENPEWKRQQIQELPAALESYPKERLELCEYLNKICIPSLYYAKECLRYFVSNRDMKELLRYNMMPVIVSHICWKKKATKDNSNDNKTDKIVKLFHQLLLETQNLIHGDFINYFSLCDFVMICLTRPHMKVKVKDTDIKVLNESSKQAAMETVSRKLRKKIHSETEQHRRFLQLHTALESVIENVGKTASILEIPNKTLPFFINVSRWMKE